MPKPAARVSDMTQHGGVIMPPGAIKTMIEMLPAARVTDMHVCPMVTVLVPHVGGPIIMGSFTTFIEMLPAARVMDQLVCVGPPDMIAKGATKTFIGDPAGGASSTMSPPPSAAGAAGGGSYQMTVGPLGEMSSPDGAPPANATVAGDPVDVATGRVFTIVEDFELPSLPGLSGSRCYSTSVATQDGAWGFGWTGRFDERLEVLPEMIVYHTWVGRRILFPLIPPDEEYLYHLDEHVLLRRLTTGYAIDDASGRRSVFTPSPRRPSTAWLSGITDASGRGIAIVRTDGVIERLHDALGGVWNFEAQSGPQARITCIEYCAPGRNAHNVCRLTYDSSGNPTSVQDAFGHVTHYQYDPLHRLIRRADRNGYAFAFQYDNLNRCTRTRGQDGLYDLSFSYGKDKPVTTVRDGLGRVIRYEHDLLGLVTRVIDAEGRQETLEYQGTNLVKRTDLLGGVTEYKYDKHGRVTAKKTPLGGEAKTEYGPYGSLTNQDAEGNALALARTPDGVTTYGLKGEDAPLWSETTDPDLNVRTRRDAFGRETRFFFDPANRLVKTVLPLGQTTQSEYDASGRRAKTTGPDGASVNSTYDVSGRLMAVSRSGGGAVQFRYDGEGNLSAFLNGNGYALRLEHGSFNKLTGVTDALGHKVAYEYDAAGRLHEITDARSNTTAFDYDGLGRLQRVLYPDGRSETPVFDPAGRLLRFHDRSGAAAEWTHDADGNPTQIKSADGVISSFSHDRAGRMTGARSADAALTFAYDGYGRLTSETLNGETVAYAYDATGRLSGLELPGGRKTRFGYDENGRLIEAGDGEGGVHRFAYSDAGPLVEHRFPNGVTARTALSALGLPETTQIGRDGESRPLAVRSYRHDGNDAVTEVTDSVLGRIAYKYDALGRIEAAQQDNEILSETFSYDPSGNITRHGSVFGFTYDPCDQLQGGPGLRCRHDARGNLVEIEDETQGTLRLVYDGRNHLVQARFPGGAVAEYEYDPFGRRIAKRIESFVTRYLWAGHHLVAETMTDPDGLIAERREYLHRPGSFTPLGMRVNGVSYSYHCDHRGAAIRVSDASGAIVWTADYSAFGEARITGAQIEQPLRLPGQYFDDETGLHYNRMRYYHPRWGRYLSPDPLGHAGGLNRYVYAENDPVNKIDPLGRMPSGLDALGRSAAGDAKQAAQSVKQAAVNDAKQEAQSAKQEAVDAAKQEAQSAKQEAVDAAKQEAQSAKQAAVDAAKQEAQTAADQAMRNAPGLVPLPPSLPAVDPADLAALSQFAVDEAKQMVRDASNPVPLPPNLPPLNPTPSTTTDADPAILRTPAPAQGASAC